MKRLQRRTSAITVITVYMFTFPIIQLSTVLVLPILYHSNSSTSIEGATYTFPFMKFASIILSIPSFTGGILIIDGS